MVDLGEADRVVDTDFELTAADVRNPEVEELVMEAAADESGAGRDCVELMAAADAAPVPFADTVSLAEDAEP